MSKSIYKYFFTYIGLVLFIGLALLTSGTQVMIKNAQNYTKAAYSKTQLGMIENIFEHEKDEVGLWLQDYAVWDDLYYSIEQEDYSWSRENATEFLVKDQSGYDVDLVYVFGTENTYDEFYGDREVLEQIKNTQEFSDTVKNHGIWIDYILINRRLFLVGMSPVTTNNKRMSNGYYLMAKEYSYKEVDLLIGRYSNKAEYEGLRNVPSKGDGTTAVKFILKSEFGEDVTDYTFHYNLLGYYESYNSLIVHTLSIVLLIIAAVMLGMNRIRKYVYKGKDQIIKRLTELSESEFEEEFEPLPFLELQEIMDQINQLALHMKEKDRNTLNHHMDTLTVIIDAIEEKDEFIKGHSRRVMKIAEIIARHMRVENIKLLKEAALLHDIGKISLPRNILNKPDKLTEEEYDLVKTHSEKGEWIVNGIPYLEDIGSIIRQHHEKVDGSGYPEGLKGDEIDIFARIISLADSFDAMISDRAYRKKMEFYQAVSIIKKERGIHFDSTVVDSLLESLHEIRLALFEEEEISEN